MGVFIRIFLFFSLTAFFSSCDNKKSLLSKTKPQILRTVLSSNIASFDPRKGSFMHNQVVIRALFAGLICLDENSVPQLDLASSYKISEGGKKYTFYLRDCKWSDGSSIIAKDFEDTWKAALTPIFTSSNSNIFYFIKNGKKAFSKDCSIDEVGVHALDDKTLVVELEQPTTRFLDILSHQAFFPVHKSMRYGDLKNDEQMVSSGPFCLKNYTIQKQIILEKNPYFWDAQNIRLDGIDFFIITKPQTSLLMFENGELDFLCEVTTSIDPSAIPTLKEKKEFYDLSAAGTRFLYINTTKFPFTNVNIRKALAYAIDRTSILKNILYKDSSYIALGLMSKILKKELWHPWFEDNNIKKAQECFAKGLEELNLTKEEFPTITISHSNNVPAVPLQAIQQMWINVLGCSVRCEGLESSINIKNMDDKKYDIGPMGWVLQYNDPAGMLVPFKSNGLTTGFSGWISEKYNQEAEAAVFSSTEAEKWQHIEKAEEIFFDEMPGIPLFHQTAAYVKHSYVKDIYVSPFFLINFRKTYIEQ